MLDKHRSTHVLGHLAFMQQAVGQIVQDSSCDAISRGGGLHWHTHQSSLSACSRPSGPRPSGDPAFRPPSDPGRPASRCLGCPASRLPAVPIRDMS